MSSLGKASQRTPIGDRHTHVSTPTQPHPSLNSSPPLPTSCPETYSFTSCCPSPLLPCLQQRTHTEPITGGLNPSNAKAYIDAGASHVIVTSYVFRDGAIDFDRLDEMVATVGKEHLVRHVYARVFVTLLVVPRMVSVWAAAVSVCARRLVFRGARCRRQQTHSY